MSNWIFKILRENEWLEANKTNAFGGAPIDVADGYIHFSTWPQLRETAKRYFQDASVIHVLAFDANLWSGSILKWEVSRGGDLFPHLYAPLDISAAERHWCLSNQKSGETDFTVIETWLAND